MREARAPFWWDDTAEAKEQRHLNVFAHVKGIEEDQKEIHRRNVIHARLYNNRELLSAQTSTVSMGHIPMGGTHENVTQSVVDTATALIARNRPKTKFLTEEADWTLQRAAKKMEKWLAGLFRQEKAYVKGVKTFKSAAVGDIGALKVIADKKRGRIRYEHVPGTQIVVNNYEAISTDPPEMHQVCFVDKEALKRQFPKFKDEIDKAHDKNRRFTTFLHVPPYQCVVIESWRKHGLHTICIENATLFEEKWDKDWFPFVFYRWSEALEGFYGQGLVEQLMGMQLRLNKLNKFIDRCQDLMSSPVIFVDHRSKISFEHLVRNEIGRLIPYLGVKPEFFTPQAVNGEIYQYKEQLKASMFRMAGIAEAQAQPIVPKRADSAPAVRAYNEIQDGRFVIQAKAYEDMFLELSILTIKAAKELYSSGKSVKARYRDRVLGFTEEIDWAELNDAADHFEMIVEAASILEDTPAGRMAAARELARDGVINMEQAQMLIDHPDVQKELSLVTVDTQLCDMLAERRREGEYIPPEEFFPLQHHIERTQAILLKDYMVPGVPEEVLDLHLRYIEDCQTLLGVSQQAQQQPATPQPAIAPEVQAFRQVQQQITSAPAPAPVE